MKSVVVIPPPPTDTDISCRKETDCMTTDRLKTVVVLLVEEIKTKSYKLRRILF